MQLTIEIPQHLSQELSPYQDRLPELLVRGARVLAQQEALKRDPPILVHDENELLALLINRPKPQTIINLQPAPALQAQITDLLWRGKQDTLDSTEQAKLDRILWLEHLVRLAKAHAFKQLAHSA